MEENYKRPDLNSIDKVEHDSKKGFIRFFANKSVLATISLKPNNPGQIMVCTSIGWSYATEVETKLLRDKYRTRIVKKSEGN